MPCLANSRRGIRPGASCWSRCGPSRPGRRSSPTSTAPWRRSSPGPRKRRCRRRHASCWRGWPSATDWSAASPVAAPPMPGQLVGLEQLAYAGNHGLELLLPGDEEPRPDPSLAGREGQAAEFVAGLDRETLSAAGLRIEDKGADPGAALARRRGRGARRGLRPRGRGRGRARRAGTALGAQGAGAAARSAAAARTRRRPRCWPAASSTAPSTPATTAPTSTPSAACTSCARRAQLAFAVGVGVVSAEAPPELRRGVRPDRRRPRGLAGDPRVAGGVAGALHRPAAGNRLRHRRRGDGAGGDHGARRQPRRRRQRWS